MMTSPRNQLDELPRRLADDLAEAARAPIAIPDEVDEAMRALTQSSATRVVLRRTAVRRWGWTAAAIAAAILVAVALWRPWEKMGTDRTEGQSPFSQSPFSARAEDIDGSGTVDILDAFALARRIEQRTATDPRWDINKDGTVDKADVDRIAQAAVSIRGGSS